LWGAFRQGISWLAPALAWFGVYWAAFLASKVLLFERYIPPTLPVYAALVGMGLVAVVRPVAQRIGNLPKRALTLVAAGAVAAYMTVLMTAVSEETQRIEDNLRIPLGVWLRSNSKPGDTILLEPISFIGYYAHRRVLDPIGLVSPSVLMHYRLDVVSPWLEIIDRYQPEWCVLRPGELAHIEEGARVQGRSLADEYALVRTVSYTPRPSREPITFHVFRRKSLRQNQAGRDG
jgi:hypothetical protein